jgi:energy-coupling factor transport system ATP-binding protein
MITIKNLSFSYDGVTNVLDDFSLYLAPGSYVSILGHNGSGKSTLAKCLAGLLTPSSGTIFVDSILFNEANLHQLRQSIGIVFQNPDNQFIGATVRDDVAFGLENRCIPHEKMESIIQAFTKAVGMESFLDREPSTLSGGQKQRVAIAGILAMQPKVIILDEATSMLDPQGKLEIRNFIQMLRKTNPSMTIVSITHDLEEAEDADHVVVLNKGKLFKEGKPADVFDDYEGLTSIQLNVPFVYEMKHKLGIKDKSITTIESLGAYLCR